MTFILGDVYDYFDMPPDLDEGWRAAFSKGRFFATHIRHSYESPLVEKAWH